MIEAAEIEGIISSPRIIALIFMLFIENSYLKEFEAKIINTENNKIILNQFVLDHEIEMMTDQNTD